jgi:hypothetical protein
MKLNLLAQALDAVVQGQAATDSIEIDRVYASDRMSDLLNHVSDTTLLVTNLVNSALSRLIELMDVPAICLLNGVEVEGVLAGVAQEHGTVLLVAPGGMYETCGRLYRALGTDAVERADT